MKNQALFSSKIKVKKLKCRLVQFLFAALRVNPIAHRTAKLYGILDGLSAIGFM